MHACGILDFNLLSFYMHMVKFNPTNTIQLKAMSLKPWLRAGSWYLEGKPVKHVMVLNNFCNLIIQQMTFQSTDNQSSLFKMVLYCCAMKFLGEPLLCFVHGNDTC